MVQNTGIAKIFRNIFCHMFLREFTEGYPLFYKMIMHLFVEPRLLSPSWKQQHHIEACYWPAQSPDLNPIEKLWRELKWAISNRNHPPRTVFELQTAVQVEWQCMSVSVVKKVVESMPEILAAVSKAQGFATNY